MYSCSSESSNDDLNSLDATNEKYRFTKREELIKKIKASDGFATGEDVDALLCSFKASIDGCSSYDDSKCDYKYMMELMGQINDIADGFILTHTEQQALITYALKQLNLIG